MLDEDGGGVDFACAQEQSSGADTGAQGRIEQDEVSASVELRVAQGVTGADLGKHGGPGDVT